MYDKKLKRGKDGLFTRYLGQNQRGVPEKFRLGYDPEAAAERLRLIAALWDEIGENAPGFKQYWKPSYLEAAKAIARGEPPTLPKGDFEDPIKYVHRLNRISQKSGTKFGPGDRAGYEAGLNDIRRQMDHAQRRIASATDVPNATGVTVRAAVTAYESHVRRSLTLPNGFLRPWGRTKLDQLESIKNYLADGRFGGKDFLALDLAELTYSRCDEMFGVFRSRPLTLRSNLAKRMTPATAKNLVKELGNFFDWLDGAEEFDWTLPRRFHAIKKTPDELTPPEKYDRRMAREKLVIPDDHLKVLFEYALPIERILLLLGLNCAFAASEIGQLRTGFLKLDRGTIEGIRFKSGNDTRHWLWQQTRDGLVWLLARRVHVRPVKAEDQDIVFVTERGKPIWHGTEKGHVSDGVSNIWYRLIRRVRKDHPEFPSYSFNKLRKTSATRVLEIADAETASMILAHKTIGEDELLHHYALLPWEKLFAAQRTMERELAPVLDAGGPEPWRERPKSYIGLDRTRRVVELHDAGERAPAIAEQLRISVATVYRLLKSREGPSDRQGEATVGGHVE